MNGRMVGSYGALKLEYSSSNPVSKNLIKVLVFKYGPITVSFSLFASFSQCNSNLK